MMAMAVLVWWAGVGCGPSADYQLLEPIPQAVRTSLVLRGVRPSTEELLQVEADPGALDDLIEVWVASSEFGATMKDLHAEFLLVRADVIDPLPAMGPHYGRALRNMAEGPAEAPLELVRHVVMEDLPYTDIVQADYMLTNALVARMYDLPYDPDGPAWQISHWQDGRPHAGLLSSTELWRRHESAGSNFNRLRADFLASAFLCESFSGRDVVPEGGVDIADEFAVADAVRTDPDCIHCHQALDPLAAFFWGYKKQLRKGTVRAGYQGECSPVPADDPLKPYAWEDYCYPLRPYGPEDEQWWDYWDLPGPAYYGRPGSDLADLGRFVAEDPRFTQCTVRRFYGWMTQSDPLNLPDRLLMELHQGFVDSGYSAKALASSIVRTPSFRALGSRRGALEVPAAGLQSVRPEQYARSIEALTGFRWEVDPDNDDCVGPHLDGSRCWGPVDLMRSDVFGFRAMFGGVNGGTVTLPVHSPTPVRELVAQAFASQAAAHVIASELQEPDPERRRFLRAVDPQAEDADAIRRQIASWSLPLLGERIAPDDPRIRDLHTLWADTRAQGGSAGDAWAFVLSAVLVDPQAMFY